MKWGRRIALIGLVVLAAIQLVRPARTNPAVNQAEALQPPEPVRAIFDRSCNDCHSNHTRWPWYSNLAPVSWLVIHDVNEGRAALNFSEWARYSHEQQKHLLEVSCEEVEEREMPPATFLPLHRAARLSDEDVRVVCDWAKQGDGVRGAAR